MNQFIQDTLNGEKYYYNVLNVEKEINSFITSNWNVLEEFSKHIDEVVNKFFVPNNIFIANLIKENKFNFSIENGSLLFSFDTRAQLLEIKAVNYLIGLKKYNYIVEYPTKICTMNSNGNKIYFNYQHNYIRFLNFLIFINNSKIYKITEVSKFSSMNYYPKEYAKNIHFKQIFTSKDDQKQATLEVDQQNNFKYKQQDLSAYWTSKDKAYVCKGGLNTFLNYCQKENKYIVFKKVYTQAHHKNGVVVYIKDNKPYRIEFLECNPRCGEVINLNLEAGESSSLTSSRPNRYLKPPHWSIPEDKLNEFEQKPIAVDIQSKLKIFHHSYLGISKNNINDVVLLQYLGSDVDLYLYILIKSIETRFGETYLLGSSIDHSQDVVFNLKNIKKILPPIDDHLVVEENSLITIKFSGKDSLKRKREE